MKCRVIIDLDREEEIVIYARERTKLIDTIESLAKEVELVGYDKKIAVRININDVYCFTVEDNKVYAVLKAERLLVKSRLYSIEQTLPPCFVKINQSCIANIGKIGRFETSVGGAMTVVFDNGIKDYVSRRQLKYVKERLGVK